jgi:hypothetical protein
MFFGFTKQTEKLPKQIEFQFVWFEPKKKFDCFEDILAMSHSAGFGYPLWAVAKDLVKHYGPWRSIWLCAMGHSAKPITIAQN